MKLNVGPLLDAQMNPTSSNQWLSSVYCQVSGAYIVGHESGEFTTWILSGIESLCVDGSSVVDVKRAWISCEDLLGIETFDVEEDFYYFRIESVAENVEYPSLSQLKSK